jgi:hypothetical protein
VRRDAANSTPGSYSEDDAVFDLAQGYLRGAVWFFISMNRWCGYEKVGINIEDAYDQVVATSSSTAKPGESKSSNRL